MHSSSCFQLHIVNEWSHFKYAASSVFSLSWGLFLWSQLDFRVQNQNTSEQADILKMAHYE